MPPNDRARRNHDELFPRHVSTLARTDPELVEVFVNFAFDEILEHGSLDPRRRLMVQLASMIACGALSEFRVMAGAALTAGVSPVELKEIVYQAVPYAGMARVFDFLHSTNGLLTERDIDLPLPSQSTSSPADRMERGLEVQKRVLGDDAVDRMYAGAPGDERHIQRYMTGNGFGDHIGRSGIDLPTRELLTFAMLVSLGGCEPQVKGHVAGNLNVGNDRAMLLSVLTQLVPFIGYPRALNGLRALNEAAPPQTES
ncbi:carboxymuconolactone decarboxylase family protein [Pseudonocardia alaniniphila]|uniref:Carboxymuconolactone decarboxylase family protein n=1 Tax=Pseudonocardia alaniniphila TaxID=75291 RepID=A0ABS9T9I0_9PSEU|nr:carboxymuconolactone decarboxylase family protein [Pseudonocardia alaniniphila]MCH6165146.1 carboxymuconolactone decarboxylase family protein [Pseudonocardia alaniniphila]